jgi:hypothetical protein
MKNLYFNKARMKFISFITMLLAISFSSTAQQTITGKVINEAGFPMMDIIVCQKQTNRCTLTKSDGSFKLTLDSDSPGIILFGYKGYISLMYALKPGEVVLPDLILQKDSTLDEGITKHLSKNQKKAVALAFEFPFYHIDFDAFEPFLGNKNIKMIESDKPHIVVGLHVPINKTTIAAGYGHIERLNDRHDTIGRKLTSHLLMVKVGYSLYENKRISIGPEAGFGWVRRRLQNFSKADRIPLEEYLNDKTLDIRFHDFVAMAGLNVSVNILTSLELFYEYISLGISGGHLAHLNRSTIIRSNGNRLTTNLRAPYEGYYFNLIIAVGM